MRRITIKFILLISISTLLSCESGMQNCVKEMKKRGFSHDDAWDMCKDEELNSIIR